MLICLNLELDSGHGGQVKDKDGDEVDGYDESQQSFHAPGFSLLTRLHF